jgi:hypothetical protein
VSDLALCLEKARVSYRLFPSQLIHGLRNVATLGIIRPIKMSL